MPFVLSPMITPKLPGLWREGNPYSKENIYHIVPGKVPPVHYDAHTLKPHSIPHVETPAHIIPNGATLESYFTQDNIHHFYGPAIVVRLPGNNFQQTEHEGIYHWEVGLEELKKSIDSLCSKKPFPHKIFLSTEEHPITADGFHDSNYVLTLSEEAAKYLVSINTQLYGTSWKSSDFQPGSLERPIHKILFQKAILMECLALSEVPSGWYFFVGFPIPLAGASESPVCPVLFKEDEIGHGNN